MIKNNNVRYLINSWLELTISLLLLFYVIVLLLQRNSTKTIKKEHSHYKVKKICNVNKKGF